MAMVDLFQLPLTRATNLFRESSYNRERKFTKIFFKWIFIRLKSNKQTNSRGQKDMAKKLASKTYVILSSDVMYPHASKEI